VPRKRTESASGRPLYNPSILLDLFSNRNFIPASLFPTSSDRTIGTRTAQIGRHLATPGGVERAKLDLNSGRIRAMKPEHDVRRVIIREWMSLPKERRKTKEQALAFANSAKDRVPCSGDPFTKITGWLLPRLNRP
jgi:hypothetical protein